VKLVECQEEGRKVYFSFDKETKELIHKLGYIPKDCYCSLENVFIPEHAKKNKEIVKGV
jgi:hypothetical protein